MQKHTQKKHIILAGGGHVHLTALKNIRELIDHGHKVSLISPSSHHYYSGMGPGLLAGNYTPDEIRFNIKQMALDRGVDFVQGYIVKALPEERKIILDTGQALTYDIASFNVGSKIPFGSISSSLPNLFPVKPIENFEKARKKVQRLLEKNIPELVVIGGGPAALEVSGALWQLSQNADKTSNITVVAGKEFLMGLPKKVVKIARKSFSAKKIKILEGVLAKSVDKDKVILDNGKEIPYDCAMLAWGVGAQDIFESFPTGPDNNLLVNKFLQCTEYPEVFGGGDCIYFKDQPLAKVGVYAVRQNPILWHNIKAMAMDTPMKEFNPGPPYLLIFNLGGGKGVFYWKNLAFSGKWCFWLKNYIDIKFMKTFQD